jgi:tight adherence protein B
VTWLAVAGLLVAGAVVIGWPGAPARHRLTGASGAGRLVLRLPRVGFTRPRPLLIGSIVGVAAVGWLCGGPVAAVVGVVYTALAGRALIRRAVRREAVAARSRALDDLAAWAADLRAGLVTGSIGAGSADAGSVGAGSVGAGSVGAGSMDAGSMGAGPAGGRLAERAGSVARLAERTGAPAADLIERIEADGRAADRAAASAAAQAAGAQATAFLLAGLPLGGIGLGFVIGADPVHVLLRTPLGAACAVTAVLLQGGGLLWAERLASGGAR